MIPKDILKNVHRIEITTSRLVNDIFAGQYHSIFKGQGIEFDEVREYQPGDDIRTIDWNVTARTGKPHIKKFMEERELTVMIVIDLSASERFASINKLKSQLAAEIAAVLAFSAIRNNDKAGLIMFTDRIEKFLPPRKGSNNVLRVIRDILYYHPEGNGTDVVGAIDYLNRVAARKTITFLISDFLFDDNKEGNPGRQEQLKTLLSTTNRRHDLIAITLNDPRECVMPDSNLVYLSDPESGQMKCVDTSDNQFRKKYREQNLKRVRERESLFRSVGMDFINISTDAPYADALVKFFRQRRRRR